MTGKDEKMTGKDENGTRKCVSCGRAFVPRRPYHRYCDACYRRLAGPRRRRGMWRYWDDPLLVLLVMLVGVFVVLLLERCGG